jgi:hypothetical protein
VFHAEINAEIEEVPSPVKKIRFALVPRTLAVIVTGVAVPSGVPVYDAYVPASGT